MNKYEVELTLTATAWIEVEAEDEAHDKAKEEAYGLSSGEWDRDFINVDSVKMVAA